LALIAGEPSVCGTHIIAICGSARSPSPPWMVVCSALDEDPAQVVAWMAGAPAQWLVSAESDLHDRLVAAGCRPERTAVVMGAPLATLELGEPEGAQGPRLLPAGWNRRAVTTGRDSGAGWSTFEYGRLSRCP
jgi:hypothetical protein